ncbi:MAG: superoxide dismutase, Ni [Candidatus Micrarchaeaceae archaeon]
MALARKVMDMLDRYIGFERAHAHCDIPCGIYDPHAMQMAAHTVLRMDMLIAEAMKAGPNMTAEDRNKVIRCTEVKEQYAELCKHEVAVLWGDYFKPEHAKNFPELHELVWNTLKLAGKAKQSVDIKNAEDLLANTHKIAEIFWKTKNVQTVKAKSFYPSEHEFVYPKV